MSEKQKTRRVKIAKGTREGLFVWLVGFLTSSSTTSRGWATRQSV